MRENTDRNIKKVRQKNYIKVVDDYEHRERGNGGERGDGLKRIALITGESENMLQKYKQDSYTKQRGISNSKARELEEKLGLDDGYFDLDENDPKDIYYIMLQVEDSDTYFIIDWLYENDFPEILECSAILGEFDIIIKAEVSDFHHLERIYSTLSKLPKAKRTQTFASANSLRWQKQQEPHYLVKNPHSHDNYYQEKVDKLIQNYMHNIRLLERGKVSVPDDSEHRIMLTDVLKSVKRRYLAVREYNEYIPDYEEYLSIEKEKIIRGVKSKRIFIIPNDLFSNTSLIQERDKILMEAERIDRIDGEVRFLSEELCARRDKSPDIEDNIPNIECFAVIDNEFVYVKKTKLDSIGNKATSSVLHSDIGYIESYLRVFKKSWDKAIPYKDICKQLELEKMRK